jgi:hypothetical protein
MNASVHKRLRIAREVSGVRQDDIAAQLRQRGLRFSQCDLSHVESGIRPVSPALARQIGEALIAIVEARLKAVKELLLAQ